MFNRWAQEPEETINHYITDVIKLLENCQCGHLQDNLIWDKLVSGITDNKVKEKLLGTKDLRLDKTIKMLKANQPYSFEWKIWQVWHKMNLLSTLIKSDRIPMDCLIKRARVETRSHLSLGTDHILSCIANQYRNFANVTTFFGDVWEQCE